LVIFSILINDVASPLFKSKRGIKHGFPLSSLLFIIIVDGLRRYLKEVSESRNIKGINVGTFYNVTHVFSIDDSLIFCEGTKRMVKKLSEIINILCEEKIMTLNFERSMMSF
jgi:hypothetical protein